jgi:hypothetical protein
MSREDTLKIYTTAARTAKPIRINIVAIALYIAVGFLIGACSAHRSAKNQYVSTMISSSTMADGKEWTTANLNVNASPSHRQPEGDKRMAISVRCVRK